MPDSKPEIVINLDEAESESPLKAQRLLSSLKSGVSYHEKHDCRHPLGIYNVSTTRILQKLSACAVKLEALHHRVGNIEALKEHEDLYEELIDYLELSLYAAAEHVDDIKNIILCFFPNIVSCEKSKLVRKLKDDIKPIRDTISAFTNAIKHQHSRIRLLSIDFSQPEGAVCLHGFFIEKFRNGGIGPALLFRENNEQVISVTSFLWSVVRYLFFISEKLEKFILSLDVVDPNGDSKKDSQLFRNVVVALARLPLYAFDDANPFEKMRVIIGGNEESRKLVESNIYGSILCRWSKTSPPKFGKVLLSYEGDGTTKQFDFGHPKGFKLCYWD